MFNKIYATTKKNIILYKKELIFLILFAIIINIRFPYYIDAPGGTISLKDRIIVENSKDLNGSLNLVYVLELDATIPTMLISLFNKNWDLIKQEEVVPTNETIEDVNKRGKINLEESMNNAVAYAYNKANKKLTISNRKLVVSYVAEDAKTSLKVGDEIISINGIKVDEKAKIETLKEDFQVGQKIDIVVKNDDKEATRYAEVYEIEKAKKIGILISELFDYETEPKIKFNYSNSEGGSSGGFINALYIYLNLIGEDLLKGKKVVGTGTIDSSGNVGEIGGIEYKLKAAVKASADLFLVPSGNNCQSALALKEERDYDMRIVCVASFDEAINYLKEN